MDIQLSQVTMKQTSGMLTRAEYDALPALKGWKLTIGKFYSETFSKREDAEKKILIALHNRVKRISEMAVIDWSEVNDIVSLAKRYIPSISKGQYVLANT